MLANNSEIDFWSAERKEIYEDAIVALISRIQRIEDEIVGITGRHIVRYTEQRLKSTQSITEKINRKGRNVDEFDAEKAINDLAGVRVICFDTRQVYTLVKEIKETNEFEVIKEKDYILHPKDNGYQSYHMILKYGEIKVELQIRTILMDAWSSLETVLIYKKTNAPTQEIVEKIRKFSKLSKKMDRMVEEMLEEKGKK